MIFNNNETILGQRWAEIKKVTDTPPISAKPKHIKIEKVTTQQAPEINMIPRTK